jgi:hypothetical protein
VTAVKRPHAVTATDLYLSLLLDEFEAQGEVLRQILDRLPGPAVEPVPGEPVEVSEPAPKLAPGKQADPESEAVPVAEPALPKRPVKKAQPKRH